MSPRASTDRKSHVGKNQVQRARYSKAIQEIDCEPTSEESSPISRPSDATGEELSEPTTKRTRPINWKRRFWDHVSENWTGWAVGLFFLVMAYFFVDAKVCNARIEEKLSSIDKSAQELHTTIQSTNSEVSAIRIDVEKSKVNIDHLSEAVKKLDDASFKPVAPLASSPH